ncbi:MAG: sugar phosphate isomerase/epimerase [Phycisphaerae bacterium]|jgi:D-psicose/D-tagatose/L-ribulose 3-epimerase
MKTGVNLMLWTGSFSKKDLKLIDKVAKMGFDGVELPLFNLAAVDVKGTRKALADAGLGATVCTVIVKGSLIGSSPADRKAALDHLLAVLDLSKELGVEAVAGPIYSPVGLLIGRGRNAAEWKHAVKGLRKVADRAEQLDIKVGVEPLNRFETFFLNICEDAVKLCKEVASSHLGILYDTFHANIEEKDPVAALRQCGRHLFHVHTCENDRGIPGSGHVPWDATMRALADMGYDGYCTIESFVPAIKELARAASIWRPLARDGDDLARSGLKFLRKFI